MTRNEYDYLLESLGYIKTTINNEYEIYTNPDTGYSIHFHMLKKGAEVLKDGKYNGILPKQILHLMKMKFQVEGWLPLEKNEMAC